MKTGFKFHRFLQQLGAIRYEQAGLFPLFAGGKELLNLLQQGVFSG